LYLTGSRWTLQVRKRLPRISGTRVIWGLGILSDSHFEMEVRARRDLQGGGGGRTHPRKAHAKILGGCFTKRKELRWRLAEFFELNSPWCRKRRGVGCVNKKGERDPLSNRKRSRMSPSAGTSTVGVLVEEAGGKTDPSKLVQPRGDRGVTSAPSWGERCRIGQIAGAGGGSAWNGEKLVSVQKVGKNSLTSFFCPRFRRSKVEEDGRRKPRPWEWGEASTQKRKAYYIEQGGTVRTGGLNKTNYWEDLWAQKKDLRSQG